MSTVSNEMVARVSALGGKYLTFMLQAEEYAIPIRHVREIVALQPITLLPHAPPGVLGVINLRGKIMPVVDLHQRFGLADGERTRETCIIVLNPGNGETGVLVDRVREVVNIDPADITPPPILSGVQTDHLDGIATHGKGARLILAVERTLQTGPAPTDRV